MFWLIALSMARRSRGFIDGSAPPSREATVISLMSRVKILPRLASVAAFLCLIFAHLLWPAMMSFREAFCQRQKLYSGHRRLPPGVGRNDSQHALLRQELL